MNSNTRSVWAGRDKTRSPQAKHETTRRQAVRVEKYGNRKGGAK